MTLRRLVPPQNADYGRWFAEEVRPHEPGLRSWLRRRFPALQDVDDVIQDAYVRLIRAKSAGRVGCAKSYLYSIARNAVLDRYRHERVVLMERMTENGELSVLDDERHGADAVCHDEELALLAEAIQSLPERCREILVLRKVHRLSQREIAQRLGIAENTVAAQASIGVRRCIAFFRERNVKR